MTGALPGGNHDHDAFVNLVDYTLGLFPAAAGTCGDVTLRVQASSNLTAWENLAVSVNSAPFTGHGFVSENRAHPLPAPADAVAGDAVALSGS